jgi:hypothetical protein
VVQSQLGQIAHKTLPQKKKKKKSQKRAGAKKKSIPLLLYANKIFKNKVCFFFKSWACGVA